MHCGQIFSNDYLEISRQNRNLPYVYYSMYLYCWGLRRFSYKALGNASRVKTIQKILVFFYIPQNYTIIILFEIAILTYLNQHHFRFMYERIEEKRCSNYQENNGIYLTHMN